MKPAPSSDQLGLPSCSSLFADYVARERAFKNIGPKRASALFAVFGAGLQDALLSIDDRVVEIIGEASAINAAAVMETRISETSFLAWLTEVKAEVPVSKAIRVARAWGDQSTEAIRKNPYLLLAVSDWDTVDSIALRLGISRNDIRRDIAAVEATLVGKAGLHSGSTLMTQEHALRCARRLLGRKIDLQVADLAVRSGAAVRLGDGLQPPGAAHMEASCALSLSRIGSQPPRSGTSNTNALDELVLAFEIVQPFALTEAQREAIKMSHRHRLLVLSGYAGSGKTTVLKGVCDTHEAVGKKPLIITLSGRAAQRATEATGRVAITVARFLIEQENSAFPLGSDYVLIADEASMLGLVEFWRILRRLGQASLVLCGDPAQLPPVSPGIVFHHLATDPNTPKVVLDSVHRQDETTGIPTIAENVRNGKIIELPTFSGPKPGVTFSHCGRDFLCDEIMRIGREMARNGIKRGAIQIIAPTNREIDAINCFFHRRVLRRRPSLWPETRHIAEGEPVIWTNNDPSRGLTNGSLGRILEIGREKIIAELDGNTHELRPNDGQFLQLAWAISVHKAQGSQWRRVIVPLFQSRILDRSLIYTALTRAQEQVVFIGSFTATRSAVERSAAAEMRRCGFPTWMKLARMKQNGDSAAPRPR